MRTAFPRRPGDTLCLTLFKSRGQGLALSESAPPERRGGLWGVETALRSEEGVVGLAPVVCRDSRTLVDGLGTHVVAGN